MPCVQLFLERTNPHMLPAASSIFFTLDKRMDGEIRYKVASPDHVRTAACLLESYNSLMAEQLV